VLVIGCFWIAGPGACRIRADLVCCLLRVSTSVGGVSLGRVWMWLTRPIPGRKLRSRFTGSLGGGFVRFVERRSWRDRAGHFRCRRVGSEFFFGGRSRG